MTRRMIMLSLALLLIVSFNPLAAGESEPCTSCTVDRSCEKIDTGLRCTVKAKGETTVEHVRSCVSTMAAKHHVMEGVSTSFEEIDGGIVVTRTASDPELIAKLHAMSDGCSAKHEGCCAHHAAAAQHEGCAHGAKAAAPAAHEGCAHGAKAAAPATHEGCAHGAKAAAAAAPAAKAGCSKPCDTPCAKAADKS